MKNTQAVSGKISRHRWTIVALLFVSTTINYLDRQVLSLTWDEFIKPEFHWDESHYGTITSFFSIFYAISMLFAGRFVEWMGTKKGFLWAIGVWSANLSTTVGDMFPQGAIATATGIGGMAGGLGSMILQKSAGNLFVYAGESNMTFLGFEGKPAGYFIIFCICAVAYLIGWLIMKALVPHYKLIKMD